VRDCFGAAVTVVYDSIGFSILIATRFGSCLLIAGQIFWPVFRVLVPGFPVYR